MINLLICFDAIVRSNFLQAWKRDYINWIYMANHDHSISLVVSNRMLRRYNIGHKIIINKKSKY